MASPRSVRLRLYLAIAATAAVASACYVVHNSAYCNTSKDCPPDFPVCDVKVNACGTSIGEPFDMSHADAFNGHTCTTSADCADDHPICATGQCRTCGSGDDSECAVHKGATPRCDTGSDTSAGTCVACVTATDCTASPGSPVCGSDHTCRPCAAHSECATGICIFDGMAGQCASSVLHVDKSSALCLSTGPGTTGSPFCEVSAAVASGKGSYILVAGSTQPYETVTVTSGNFVIVGPGRSAPQTALITKAGSSAPAIAVTPSGANAISVVLDGLDLAGAAGATPSANKPAILCQNGAGTASVTVRNSILHNSGGAGIDVTGCTLVADANIIGVSGINSGNNGGGILFNGTQTYTITNNIIAGNGTSNATVPGVALGNQASGTFAFNTVAANLVQSTAGVGGVDCGSASPKNIVDSIFVQNTKSGTTQIGAQCTLVNVVTAAGDDTKGSMSASPPKFQSGSDYHLKSTDPANTACCIDKLAAPAGIANSGHDVDGTSRPQGTNPTTPYDIGAQEVKQ